MAERRVSAPIEDPIFAIIRPALKVGAVCGTTGFILGGAAGIVKGTTPFLFATASGLQTFGLGTTFWICRSTVLQAWTPEYQKPNDLVKASALSGAITGGSLALLTRGRSNVIPGALMFSLFGFLGQSAYNKISVKSESVRDESKQGFWRRMSEKSWSPVKIMNDEEYAEMLREKMLKVDVEISIIDDKIAALRNQHEIEGAKESPSPSPEEGV
ncbi:hypothetical protein LTR37_003076 [Vermiconidia calcicola]|uniref:Uncharacterized protein n=1 Tax=Vermiconidia calcicola TaxID=1690605 RepID=A0ACC3NSK1_9PEZI|nr:hypothetical protein LTR37_003076 [Vermiconidia calcicola]